MNKLCNFPSGLCLNFPKKHTCGTFEFTEEKARQKVPSLALLKNFTNHGITSNLSSVSSL